MSLPGSLVEIRQNTNRDLRLSTVTKTEEPSTDEAVYVALGLALDIASQGLTIEAAKVNLREAMELV